MNNQPLISVIVPTYKRTPQLIQRAIDSVLKQSYSNLELIIIDDSPSDYLHRKSVKEYINSIKDARVKYIQHIENLGANKARNTGIGASSGEYCAFLDDDDEWVLNKLELQMKKFVNEDVGLVYCRAIIIDEVNNIRRPIINEIKQGEHYSELLKQNFIGSNSFVLIRKEVLVNIGCYDEELESNQDYDLFLRISKEYKIAGCNEVLVKYYLHDGERITTNMQKQLQGRLALHNKHAIDIKKDKVTKLTWELKIIPLYYKTSSKKIALIKLLKLFITHPIFCLRYSFKTLSYIKKKRINVARY
ncbi:glycosyltransferase [Fundicoccus ignavus]|uniref:Glycosyltransferase n=1 Tax=Fundicoccus ignavus TaxID=2664442 RepID=A0A844CCK5_9LACT|nr:glycosyltransferase [Fundicoccus ignavus]MRJ46910.1 glycosyltransferase [Fundicoccus ignavus]